MLALSRERLYNQLLLIFKNQYKMSRELLPGYDTSYCVGDNKEVDNAIFDLSQIIGMQNGGIINLDKKGNSVMGYTDDVELKLSDELSEEIRIKARAAALTVLQAMDKHRKELEQTQQCSENWVG
jgi:hypothetical protein